MTIIQQGNQQGLVAMTWRPKCADCGAADAPHRGEQRSTRIADGVVRDVAEYRCSPCQSKVAA